MGGGGGRVKSVWNLSEKMLHLHDFFSRAISTLDNFNLRYFLPIYQYGRKIIHSPRAFFSRIIANCTILAKSRNFRPFVFKQFSLSHYIRFGIRSAPKMVKIPEHLVYIRSWKISENFPTRKLPRVCRTPCCITIANVKRSKCGQLK